MSAAPRVSVVMPVWEAAATLGEAVASVRAQTVTDWELLLVDDGSRDGSGALADALAAGEPRIRRLGWADNRGAAAARNAGIRAARGRYIAFLDADDLWYPGKLAAQLAFMAAGGYGLVHAAYRRVAADGRPLGIVRPPARVDHGELLKSNVIGCLTAVYDTACFGKVEMPSVRRRQDFGLWLELLRRSGGAAHALPEVLADYRVRPGSLSADKLAAARATWAIYREVEGLGLPRAGWYFLHYAARGVAGRLRDRRQARGAAPPPSG